MPTSSSRSLIDDLIEIKDQLNADSSKSYEALQQRDRLIGIELAHLKNTPLRQVRAWLGKVHKATAGQPTGRLSRGKIAVSSLLIFAGLLIGTSAALALFYYTGEQPINVINVLAVGVGLQLLLLLVFILAVVSPSPWLQNLLSGFNAGRWGVRFAYFIPAIKDSLEKLMNWQQELVDEKIVRWQTILWSQQFAVAFNIALILCCLYLVTFSDLAFGWSTTLAFDNTIVQSITDALSWPWKSIFPAAVPDLQLIDATRYYRLKTISMGNQTDSIVNQAQLAGNWWRFLLLCLVVYGLIPRMITLIVAKIKLTRSISRSIFALPGLHLLLDRMNTPNIATNAETPEPAKDQTHAVTTQQLTPLTNRETHILHWGQPALKSDKLMNWIKQSIGTKPLAFSTVASDNSTNLSHLDILPPVKPQQALAIMVKAWEPPTLELTDWLTDSGAHYGNQTLIAVIPYDLGPDNEPVPATLTDSQTWQNFLLRQNLNRIEFHGARG